MPTFGSARIGRARTLLTAVRSGANETFETRTHICKVLVHCAFHLLVEPQGGAHCSGTVEERRYFFQPWRFSRSTLILGRGGAALSP